MIFWKATPAFHRITSPALRSSFAIKCRFSRNIARGKGYLLRSGLDGLISTAIKVSLLSEQAFILSTLRLAQLTEFWRNIINLH